MLCESRRESGVIRVFHFLSKKINPIIAHALQRMCKYSGNTLGVRVLSLTLKRIMVDHLYSAILLLKKIKPSVPVKNCNSREKQAKLAFLQRVATFYRLNRLVNKKSKLNPNHMMLFMGFMTWKKLHGHVNLENSMQLFMLAPNQRLIELACIFLGAVYSHQRRNQCANKFSV